MATFGKPDPFEVDLSGGSLTTEYPIDLPPGPDGLKPPLTLAYNSADVADQHSPQGAAPWVGEGWNLTMGSISWSEHNVQSGGGGAPWEDTWQLSDPYGTAVELMPPATNIGIYYDDSHYYNPGNPNSSAQQWQTAPNAHIKVFSYLSTLQPGGGNLAPCFRVFLTNGIKEQFGCDPTADSFQWYPEPTGSQTGDPYIANWLLDTIIDRNGNQIHIHYQSDTAVGAGGKSYPRDFVLSSVEWDSPGCTDLQNECGTAQSTQPWNPQMRVSFTASHSVAHVDGSQCTSGGSPRCDDPIDLSGSGGLAAPTIQSTFVLNDMYVQIYDGSTPTWNTLKHYQFDYDQSAPVTITDTVSGLQESTAGRLLLTALIATGTNDSIQLPGTYFGYTNINEYYVDSLQRPNPSNNCGPSWNVPCNLWSQSRAGNDYYLSIVNNGLGMNETFSWQNAHDNMHGVVGGGSNTSNPFYCNGSGLQNQWPCYDADDEAWSRVVLTQRQDSVMQITQAGQGGSQTTVPVNSQWNYAYSLVYPLPAQECGTCVAGYMWGNQNDNDYLDFYNGRFMGFAQANVGNPDGSQETHKFYSTEGWGLYDTTQVSCLENPPNPCHNDPWWDSNYLSQGLSNALHGSEYEFDLTATDGVTLVKKVVTSPTAICPPINEYGSPPVGSMTWWGNLVGELDLGNPIATCELFTYQVDTYMYDGSSNSSHRTRAYMFGTQGTADPYGRLTKETDTSSNGASNGSPTTIVQTYAYVWDDAVTAGTNSATGTYLIDFQAYADVEDSAGNQYQCTETAYDGQPWTSGQQSSALTKGDATNVKSFMTCGSTPAGPITNTHGYDQWGNQWAGKDPDANAGISGHTGCVINSLVRSFCDPVDSYFDALTVSHGNALNQSDTINYQSPSTASASLGFGLWPQSTTDVNSQSTFYTYDVLGRQLTLSIPPDASGTATQTMAYTTWCPGANAHTPCAEIDRTQRISSTQSVTYRAFYDGLGHLVETRSPSPSGDVVQYYLYDASQRLKSESIPYFVTSYTGGPGSAAYSIPDTNQVVTSYAYDSLGRTISTTDPLSEVTTTSYTVQCNVPGTGDSACYEQVLTKDPLQHQSLSLTDAMGRIQYEQRFTGNSSYTLYATTKYTYDFLGRMTKLLQPDGATTTSWQYDMAGRLISLTDPDLGTIASSTCTAQTTGEPAFPTRVSACYYYDPDGNLLEAIDPRGSAGMVYNGFDGIDRRLWQNTTNTASGAFNSYCYDNTGWGTSSCSVTQTGNFGIGRLTGEAFKNAPDNTLSGSSTYAYDARGRQTQAILAISGAPSMTLTTTFDDANVITGYTYPDGEPIANVLSPQDWLTGVNTVPVTGPYSGFNVPLLSSATYAGSGGASGLITGATFNFASGSDSYSGTYDLMSRPTDLKLTRNPSGATDYEENLPSGYDGAGNIPAINITLAAGTDHQVFCYDEQNRLTAAASSGTVPCQTFSSGTLTAANYNQAFSYDTMGRLTSAPLGAYTYGDSSHVHAATAIGSTYSAAYDAAGNMTCRNTVSTPSANCSSGGGTSGAVLGYNALGQMSSWQNQASNPSNTAKSLYDGQGNRVEQMAVSGSTTTTTIYAGQFEEDSSVNGGAWSKTTYYYGNGQRLALATNGIFYHLVTDLLGSSQLTFDANGNLTASVLYGPYGGVRYGGSLPTDRGFTGQIADATSGLDYYNARYYDATGGQFTRADSVLPTMGHDVWGLSRYAYVDGNPVGRTDPAGLCVPFPDCLRLIEQHDVASQNESEPIISFKGPLPGSTETHEPPANAVLDPRRHPGNNLPCDVFYRGVPECSLVPGTGCMDAFVDINQDCSQVNLPPSSSDSAPSGGPTIGFCVNAQGAVGVGGTVSNCAVSNGHKNGTAGTVGGGVGLGWSFGGGILIASAPKISDLGGPFNYVSCSAAAGGVTVFWGNSPDGLVVGAEADVGPGIGCQGGVSDTDVHPS